MPATIHIVDDDPSFRVTIARLLRAAGYQVVVYESGQQLLANPPATEAGCILLDMRMPEFDGLDVQERLNEIGSSLPIVFLTGHGSVETSVQAIKAGAEDVLTKPVSKTTLIEAIERALARYRKRIDQRSKLAILKSASLPTNSPVQLAGGLDARFCEIMDAAPVMIWVSGLDKQWPPAPHRLFKRHFRRRPAAAGQVGNVLQLRWSGFGAIAERHDFPAQFLIMARVAQASIPGCKPHSMAVARGAMPSLSRS